MSKKRAMRNRGKNKRKKPQKRPLSYYGKNRDELLKQDRTQRRMAYQHTGIVVGLLGSSYFTSH